MEREKIIPKLRRYSFKSKMDWAQKTSVKITDIQGFPHADGKEILPWEIEFFVHLSILHKEAFFKNMEEKDFMQVMNGIRNFVPASIIKPSESESLERYFTATALQQFPFQGQFENLLVRYRFLFTYHDSTIDMNEEIKQLVGVDAMQCLTAGFVLHSLCALGNKFDKEKTIFFKKNKDILRAFCITRDEYIEIHSPKVGDTFLKNYYDFKRIRVYPFIADEEYIYIPLPYMMPFAVTESLLNRLTYNNDKLRNNFGKIVLEAYLLNILHESNVYDEIIGEQKYTNRKRVILTPDAMVRLGDCAMFFDSKASSPSIGIRVMDDNARNKFTKIQAKNVAQMYRRMQDYMQGLFNPFVAHQKIERDKLFGILVLFNDSFVSREPIYNSAIDLLRETESSVDATYVRSNIAVVGLDDIERFAFNELDCFEELKERKKDGGKRSDYTLWSYSRQTPKYNSEYTPFNEWSKFVHDGFSQLIN